MNLPNVTTVFVILVVVLVFYAFYLIFQPFFVALLWALVLATLFYPFYETVRSWLKGREGWASLLVCLSIILILVVPVFLLLSALVQQSGTLVALIQEQIQGGELDRFLDRAEDWYVRMRSYIAPIAGETKGGLRDLLLHNAQRLRSFIVDQGSKVITSFTGFLINFVIMLVALYYFFKDGARLATRLQELEVVPGEYEAVFIQQFKQVTYATLYGGVLTACAQGFLGGVGVWMAGLPGGLLWGALMAFLSLIPVVGTFLVWGPAAAYLLLTGRTGAGIFLIAWGTVVVGLSDNVLRPYLIRGKVELHPLLIFLSILGGLKVFGFSGIVMGPVIVAFFVALIRLYQAKKEAAS